MNNFCEQGFLTLTSGKSITINGNEGWRGITILCPSDSGGNVVISSTLSGVARIGGELCDQITLTPGNSITLGVSVNNDANGVIVTTAAGATAMIAASRFATAPVVAP